MGYRYEYEEVDESLLDEIGEIIGGVFTEWGGGSSSSTVKCTIYDEDTDEELAEGLGNSEDEAKWAAERNL